MHILTSSNIQITLALHIFNKVEQCLISLGYVKTANKQNSKITSNLNKKYFRLWPI